MTPHNETICRGITKLARELGVCYTHLWKVLTGSYDSPSLVLKINDRCPAVFGLDICKIKYKDIIRKNKGKYTWDEGKDRYIKIRKTTH